MAKVKKHGWFNGWFTWLVWWIITAILIFQTGFSNIPPEYKVTWILIELIIFMLSYKFWLDAIE
jgi:hypothetical protein